MTNNVKITARLDSELKEQLECASRVLHRGKNWIIVRAIEQYLAKINKVNLAKEARRQSLLACHQDKQLPNDWEEMQDSSGWG